MWQVSEGLCARRSTFQRINCMTGSQQSSGDGFFERRDKFTDNVSFNSLFSCHHILINEQQSAKPTQVVVLVFKS